MVSFTTSAPKSSGLMFLSDPFFAFPTGVRAPARITASFIFLTSLFDLVSYVVVSLLPACVSFFLVFLVVSLSLKRLLFLCLINIAHQLLFHMVLFHLLYKRLIS